MYVDVDIREYIYVNIEVLHGRQKTLKIYIIILSNNETNILINK